MDIFLNRSLFRLIFVPKYYFTSVLHEYLHFNYYPVVSFQTIGNTR